jgi:hypothetical protein
MIRVEVELQNRYTLVMDQEQIQRNEHRLYLKWLRYYLDFCHKYDFNRLDDNSLPPFIEKLFDLKNKMTFNKGRPLRLFTYFILCSSRMNQIEAVKQSPPELIFRRIIST